MKLFGTPGVRPHRRNVVLDPTETQRGVRAGEHCVVTLGVDGGPPQ